jgi:hypothetical protein
MKNSIAFYRDWVSLRATAALVVASISIVAGDRPALGQITKIGEPRPVQKPSAKRPPSPLPEDEITPMDAPNDEALPGEPEDEAAPKGPLLVLKNGNLIFGDIEETGDYYQVTSGKAGKRVEMRFHRNQVEMLCETVTEAFQRRQPAARKGGPENWLKFIAWCIRYRMFEHAKGELEAFSEAHPKSRRVAEMQKQIDFQQSEPEKPEVGPSSSLLPVEKPLPEEFTGQRVREIPEETMEVFNRTVQPLLVRSCASVRCHGGESKNFLLTYSSMSKGFSSQATQRNLRATLAHINFRDPEASPLLNMAIEAHGGSTKAPIVDARDKQFHVLASWIERLAASHVAQRPATIRPQESTLRQVRASPEQLDDEREPTEDEIDVSDAPTLESIRSGKKKRYIEPFVPKDPFDPEIFNRKHHEKPSK